MAAPGSRATATGLFLMLIAASAGVISSGGFAGVLAGASLILVGVRVAAADDPTAPAGHPGVALVRCLRRNLAVAGLLVASSAATAAADRETAPVLCFCAFALLLVGLSVLNVGVVLLGEQEEH